jgi:hypothetical protein
MLCPLAAIAAQARRIVEDPTIRPERYAERDAVIRDLLRDVRMKLRAGVGNLVGSEMTRASYATAALRVPKPKPSEYDRVAPALGDLGWSGGELSIIRRRLSAAPAATVGRFDARGIEIGGQRLSRHELREGARPVSWSNVAAWHSQFPELPEEAR